VLLILDFGSQYTQLIARRIRDARVFSVVLPPSSGEAEIRKWNPAGLILSGGPQSVTFWLHRWRDGDNGALDELTRLVCADLRRLAAHHLRSEMAGHTLQATALVHELYLRISSLQEMDWKSSGHFVGVAAQMMRRILTDHARRRLAQKRLRVTLKGGDIWWVPIGRRSAEAIDRYLRARARSRHAGSPWLWIGTRGHNVSHFGDSGIRAMLRRRGREAGVQNAHPHRFRHTFADAWLAAGGDVDSLMNVAGWKSITMPLRYAQGRGIARAADAHRRLSPGDRL